MNLFWINNIGRIDFELFTTNKKMCSCFTADWIYKLSCILDMVITKHLLVVYKPTKYTNTWGISKMYSKDWIYWHHKLDIITYLDSRTMLGQMPYLQQKNASLPNWNWNIPIIFENIKQTFLLSMLFYRKMLGNKSRYSLICQLLWKMQFYHLDNDN